MENIAQEKLRIMSVIKENAMTLVFIIGLVWSFINFIILPIKQLEWSVSNILNNHLKTIQDEQIVATKERQAQTEILNNIQKEIVKLQTIVNERIK